MDKVALWIAVARAYRQGVASSRRVTRASGLRFSIACSACALRLAACSLDTSPSSIKTAEAVDASAPITLQPNSGDAGRRASAPARPPTDAATPGGKTGIPGTPIDAGMPHDASGSAAAQPKDASVAVDAGAPHDASTKPPRQQQAAAGCRHAATTRCRRVRRCPARTRPHCAKDHSCVACEAHADCTQAGAPRCEPVTHACVQCLMPADCSGDTPVCDPGSHTLRAMPRADGLHRRRRALRHCQPSLRAVPGRRRLRRPRNARTVITGNARRAARARNARISRARTCAARRRARARGTCVECAAHADCKSATKPQCSRPPLQRVHGRRRMRRSRRHDRVRHRRRATRPPPRKRRHRRVRRMQCPGQTSACGDRVCDSIQKRCTQRARQSAGLCQACVSDRECSNGRMCATLDATNPRPPVTASASRPPTRACKHARSACRSRARSTCRLLSPATSRDQRRAARTLTRPA